MGKERRKRLRERKKRKREADECAKNNVCAAPPYRASVETNGISEKSGHGCDEYAQALAKWVQEQEKQEKSEEEEEEEEEEDKDSEEDEKSVENLTTQAAGAYAFSKQQQRASVLVRDATTEGKAADVAVQSSDEEGVSSELEEGEINGEIKSEVQCVFVDNENGGESDSNATRSPPSSRSPSSEREEGEHVVKRSRLHLEIETFCESITPTEVDLDNLDNAVNSLERRIQSIFRDARLVVYGSQMYGMQLPSSDIDIVIRGCSDAVIDGLGVGFDTVVRHKVTSILTKICDHLKETRYVREGTVIATAKIPVIKLVDQMGYRFDLSIGTENGIKAAEQIQRLVVQYEQLRPLCLVLKCFLKERKLNETYTGGIGSYVLVNMVTALFKMEKVSNESDMGVLLVNFLSYFQDESGHDDTFQYKEQAISINRGGVIAKAEEWKNHNNPGLLAVEDPQEMGRDMGKTCFRIDEVKVAFAQTLEILFQSEEAREEASFLLPISKRGGTSYASNKSYSLLSSIIPVERKGAHSRLNSIIRESQNFRKKCDQIDRRRLKPKQRQKGTRRNSGRSPKTKKTKKERKTTTASSAIASTSKFVWVRPDEQKGGTGT